MGYELSLFNIDGQRIAAQQEGDVKRPLAILIHGWSSSHYAMSPLLPALNQRYHCLAVDLPGYGQSPALPQPVSITAYADLIAGLIQSITNKPVVLIGHSMGGMISLTVALRHPQLVERLVLLSPTITGKLTLFINLFVSPLTLIEGSRITSKIGGLINPYILGFVDQLLRPAAFSERSKVDPEVYHRLRMDVRRPEQGKIRAECYRAMRSGDLSGKLNQIKSPALAIWGLEDNTVPLRDASILNDEWPDADLRFLPTVSHWPQFEATERTNRHVTAFLSKPLKLLNLFAEDS